MQPLPDRIAMAERHVRDGRAIVLRQRQLIELRQSRGHGTDSPRELLAHFERALAMFESDLKRLRGEQAYPS